ncbi:unnamed protein product [Ectocarpus sp. 12 AP-2014]
MSCDTLEGRQKANAAKPCEKAFGPVFPEAIAGYVAPSILFLGMTVVGYGLSTGRKWAVSGLVSPSTQMSIMLLLMVADHCSTFWDHSRVSDEKYCLTSMLTSTTYDDATGRVVFGGLGALLAAAAAYGVKSGSITLAATSIPFASIMCYLCWSPQDFQSCKANGLVTGGLAFGLDVMTFVGIMETLLAASGNKDTSWHMPTIMYCVVISALLIVLIGWHSEYGERIKDASCAIDDGSDVAAEKLVDRTPELCTGVLMSAVSIAFYVYLKMNFSEISCCATYPALLFLGFNILTKLQVFKRGEPLVGDAAHRSFIYSSVQVLDVMLSSSTLLSVMSDQGLVVGGVAKSRGLLAHGMHFVGGSITYVWNVLRLVVAIVSGRRNAAATGSTKQLAEVIKMVS